MHLVRFRTIKYIRSILLRKYFFFFPFALRKNNRTFFSPSPIGTYISISLALTPTTLSYTPGILSALATAISQNPRTPLGRQLSIDPNYVTNIVTQDSTPYTCKYQRFELI